MLSELLLYAAIGGVQIVAGVALLAALRVRVDPEVRLLLAASALQAVWACVFSVAVAANVPVRAFTPFVWAGTALLAVRGVWLCGRAWHGRGGREAAGRTSGSLRAHARPYLLPLWCGLLGLLALAPYLGPGLITNYRGSGVPDGWSYVAVGQFLWSHAQETAVDGLSLLHRYGSTFAHQRHVSTSELGVLSWLVRPGETQMGAGLLQALSVWSFALSCAGFARLRGHTAGFAAAAAGLAALSGWSANVIWLSNYDHSLALTFTPALAALAVSAEGRSAGGAAALGLLAAGTMHTYPELSVVVLGTIAAAYLVQAWHDRQLAARLGLAAITALTAAALVGLYWPDYLAYLRYQASTRPAQAILQGLIDPRYMLSAFWALGGEHRAPMLLAGQALAGALLFVVLARGAVRLVRRGESGLAAALALFLAGAAYGMVGMRYGYGTYKILLSGWWLFAYTLVLAAAAPRLPRSPGLAAVVPWRQTLERLACAAIILAIPGAVLVRDLLVVPSKQPQPMTHLRAVEEVPRLIGAEPLALLVDNLDAAAWSLYFLRDLSARQTRIGDFSGYVAAPHLRPSVDPPDALPWDRFRFALTDAEDHGPVVERPGWRLVWRKGAFALWAIGDAPWALVTDVQQGDEVMVAPLPVVPLGPAIVRVTVLASTAGTLALVPDDATLSAAVVGSGRLRGVCGDRPIGIDLEVTPFALRLPVGAGETHCHWQAAPSAGGPPAAVSTAGRMHAIWTPSEAGSAVPDSGPAAAAHP